MQEVRLFHCCHHEIEFVFIAFLFPFRKVLGKRPDRLFLHPLVLTFPPLFQLPFFLSPRSLSSSMFLFHVLVPTAGLLACLCPGFPRVMACGPVTTLSRRKLRVPEASSGCWQDSSTVPFNWTVCLAFPSPVVGSQVSAWIQCLSLHLQVPQW